MVFLRRLFHKNVSVCLWYACLTGGGWTMVSYSQDMVLCGSSLDGSCGSWSPFTRSGSANLDLVSFVQLTGANGTIPLSLKHKFFLLLLPQDIKQVLCSLSYTHTIQNSCSHGLHLITKVHLQLEGWPATALPTEWDSCQIQACGHSTAASSRQEGPSALKGG